MPETPAPRGRDGYTFPAMPDTGPLHDTDFLAWTRHQAEALRAAAQAGTNVPLDWELLAEEIEDLGRQIQYELEKRLTTVIEHLLRLQFSPATHAHAGWRQTIRRSRQHIASLLKGNRTLREKVPALIADVGPPTAQRVAEDLQDSKELDSALLTKLVGAAFTEDEVLGGWFPANIDDG